MRLTAIKLMNQTPGEFKSRATPGNQIMLLPDRYLSIETALSMRRRRPRARRRPQHTAPPNN